MLSNVHSVHEHTLRFACSIWAKSADFSQFISAQFICFYIAWRKEATEEQSTQENVYEM